MFYGCDNGSGNGNVTEGGITGVNDRPWSIHTVGQGNGSASSLHKTFVIFGALAVIRGEVVHFSIFQSAFQAFRVRFFADVQPELDDDRARGGKGVFKLRSAMHEQIEISLFHFAAAEPADRFAIPASEKDTDFPCAR